MPVSGSPLEPTTYGDDNELVHPEALLNGVRAQAVDELLEVRQNSRPSTRPGGSVQ
jgi:hypothetical protein